MGDLIAIGLKYTSVLLALVKAGTAAWNDIKEIRDSMNDAQSEGRDLTNEEFAKLMALNYAPGDELQELAGQADETLIAELPGKANG